jgi:hypothetical protein
MRITLLGGIGALAVAALLVYVGYELHRTSQAKAAPPQENPDSSTNS